MFSQVTAYFMRRSDLLLAGDYDKIAAQYIYPLPMYLGCSRVIVRNADEMTSMLCLLRSAYLQRGVITTLPHLTALDLPRSGSFRAWVDWQELALPAEHTRVSSAIYYCRTTATGLKVEMVEYTKMSMPELNPHFAALALSA
jgi:hypothetical protein